MAGLNPGPSDHETETESLSYTCKGSSRKIELFLYSVTSFERHLLSTHPKKMRFLGQLVLVQNFFTRALHRHFFGCPPRRIV